MARYDLIPALVAVVSLAVPAAAADNSSAYTKIILDQCRQEPHDPEDPLQGGVWWCEGYGGVPVRVEEGDERFQVSYGAAAVDELAASQTLPAFNTINDTLERRLDAAGQPFATILRFFTSPAEGDKVQVLVVTKVGPPGQVLPDRHRQCLDQSGRQRDRA